MQLKGSHILFSIALTTCTLLGLLAYVNNYYEGSNHIAKSYKVPDIMPRFLAPRPSLLDVNNYMHVEVENLPQVIIHIPGIV